MIVNDGSTDNSASVISSMQQQFENIVTHQHASTKGIAASWKQGLSMATFEIVCLMDADLQNLPEDVIRLWRKLDQSRVDFVQGARSEIGRTDWFRLVQSRVLNALLNFVFSDNASDSKSGFLVGHKGPILEVVGLLCDLKSSTPHTFIRVAAKALGLQVAELETLFAERLGGSSFLTVRKSLTIAARLPIEALWVRSYLAGLKKKIRGRVFRGLDFDRGIEYPFWRKVWMNFYFLTLPAHSWNIGYDTRKLFLELFATQWLSRDELTSLQDAKLKNLLLHVARSNPYYSNQLSVESVLSDPRSALMRMPLLSKDDVKANTYFELFSEGHSKSHMARVKTSGSTGEPMTFFADRYQLEMRFATTLRQLHWTGWRFGDKQMRLWHQTLGMNVMQAIKERLDALILRRKFIPAFEMTDQKVNRLLTTISKFRPVLIDGYAESFNYLSRFAVRSRPEFSPRAIMSSAQTLSDDVRKNIETSFNTKVFDKYGSREFSGIAYQCGQSPYYHVMSESYVVEILKSGREAKPGQVGEVVVTDLNNLSFPLIRYRLGDLAVAAPEGFSCKCGRNLPVIGKIVGRTQALIHCDNGTWLPGTFFAHFFKDFEDVCSQYQVVQKTAGEFTVKLVKASTFREARFSVLTHTLQSSVGSGTRIHFEFTTSIPLTRTGKRTPVVSSVKPDFQSL